MPEARTVQQTAAGSYLAVSALRGFHSRERVRVLLEL